MVLRDYTGVELGALAGYEDGSMISKFASGLGEMSLRKFHRLSVLLSERYEDNRVADTFSGGKYRNQIVLADGNRRRPESSFLEILEAGGSLRASFDRAPTYALLELIDRMRCALHELERIIRDRDRRAA